MDDDNTEELDRQAADGIATNSDGERHEGLVGHIKDAVREMSGSKPRDPSQGEDSGFNVADVSDVNRGGEHGNYAGAGAPETEDGVPPDNRFAQGSM